MNSKKDKIPIKEQQVKFSTADDELLIDLIIGYSSIWDVKDPEYKEAHKKSKIWNELDRILKKSDGQCKTRWRSIRDHYKRQEKLDKLENVKKRAAYWDRLSFLRTVEDERETPNNSVVEIENFKLEGDESLLETHDEIIDNNIQLDVNVKSNEEQRNRKRSAYPEQIFLPGPSYKRQKTIIPQDIFEETKETRNVQERQRILNYVNRILLPEDENEIDLFFRSIAATVKKFNPEDIPEVKMKIFNIVTEAEIRNHKNRIHIYTMKEDSRAHTSPRSSISVESPSLSTSSNTFLFNNPTLSP